MKENALISVIVPVYKVEQYLSKCVGSILNQTYPNLEVILVDDGSPDGSGAICDSFAARDSRVRVIHKRNGGLSDARNAGIDMASGDYFAFVDSDDWVEPDAYETMLALAQKYDAKIVCAGRYDEDSASGAQTLGLCPEKEELISGKEAVRRILRWEHMDSSACDKLYARELYADIRYPVGRVVEDVATTYRLVLLAGNMAMLPKPVYHYCHREQSITTASVSEKTFHTAENAGALYEFICENYPNLEPDARHFLTQAQRNVVQELELSDKATRKKFAGEYKKYRRALVRQLPFVMGYDLFSPRSRVEVLLVALGLFSPAVHTGRFLKKLRKGL